MMSREDERGGRLDGPIPVGVDTSLAPIEARKVPIKQDDAMEMTGVILAAAMIPVVIWLFWPVKNGFVLAWLVVIVCMFSTIVVLVGFILRTSRVQWRADRAVLGVDGIRLFVDDLLVREVRFDRDTWVEVYGWDSTDGATTEGVFGYFFRTGIRTVKIDLAFGYSQEDVEEMWPLVRAAAWKHRMRLGENIRKLIDSEEG